MEGLVQCLGTEQRGKHELPGTHLGGAVAVCHRRTLTLLTFHFLICTIGCISCKKLFPRHAARLSKWLHTHTHSGYFARARSKMRKDTRQAEGKRRREGALFPVPCSPGLHCSPDCTEALEEGKGLSPEQQEQHESSWEGGADNARGSGPKFQRLNRKRRESKK